MKFSICNEIFKDWDFPKAAGFAAQVGYEAIEIAPFTFARHVTEIPAESRDRIKNQAKDAGIAISGIHWVLIQTEGLHMTDPDAAIRKKTAQYFCDLVQFCSDIGGEAIVVGSPKQRNLREGVSKEQGFAWAKEVFRDAVRLAEDRGVTICLEPLAPTETNFINTAEEAVEFTQDFDSRAFKIILDVKAMCSEKKPIPEIIEQTWPNFGYFHANDANLKGPGFGDVDFAPIAEALRKVGYQGFVSVEVFNFEEGAETIARQSFEYLQTVFDGNKQ